jgi:hypothetical protein
MDANPAPPHFVKPLPNIKVWGRGGKQAKTYFQNVVQSGAGFIPSTDSHFLFLFIFPACPSHMFYIFVCSPGLSL